MAEMEELNMEVAPEALERQKKFYDERYAAGYMESFEYDVYERCRLYTVQKVLATLPVPKKILDYGCGQGRYIAELRKIFTLADISGCDVSDQGLEIARTNNPGVSFLGMDNESIDCLDESFDLVISIEVLEHVGDVRKAIQEIVRVLRPGGTALITTPCANRFSLEWVRNFLSGGLLPSHDGYGRFATDEPGHLRRLTSTAMSNLFANAGADPGMIRFRAHLFTTLVETGLGRKLLPISARAKCALLDWHLFRALPNGATMIALYRKR
jgi:ubiquinone/menaquinone biosynthesis C-methylase UbiE